MAKFAQYFLRFTNDNLFAQERWAERQQLLGKLLETDESMEFLWHGKSKEGTADKPKRVYKHKVYHITDAPDIVVMRIANVKEMVIEKDFHSETIEHNPSCFVIFDNRNGCRRLAIQKLATSFKSTDLVRKILQKGLGDRMKEHYIGLEMSAQRYPKDFYSMWRAKEHHTARLRFNIAARTDFSSSERTSDHSLVGHILALEEASNASGYKSAIDVAARDKGGVLYVDESSEYIRSLVEYSATTASPIELITTDGASFDCYIDSDLESDDKIVTVEIATEHLESLFGNDEDARKLSEAKVMEFVNSMKYVVDDKEIAS